MTYFLKIGRSYFSLESFPFSIIRYNICADMIVHVSNYNNN